MNAPTTAPLAHATGPLTADASSGGGPPPASRATDTPGWHRPPRLFPDQVPSDPVVVAAPPPLAGGTRGPGWLLAGVGALGGLGMVVFAITTRDPRFMVAAIAVAALTAAASVTVHVGQRRAAGRQDRRSVARYRAHLAASSERLEAVAAAQRGQVARLHPDPAALLGVAGGRTHLWERRPGDPDFLILRLGLGPVPLAAPVTLQPTDLLAEHDPQLLTEAEATVDGWRQLAGMPVAAPLQAPGPLAITGDPAAARALARALLCQLAVWHAPGEVQLLAYLDPNVVGEWQWLKWLPHVHQATDPAWAVTVTTDPADLQVLLDRIVAPRLALLDRDRPASSAADPGSDERVVLLLDGYDPAGEVGQLPLVAELLDRGGRAGVHTLLVAANDRQLPSRLHALAHVDAAGRLDYLDTGPGGRRERGLCADAASVELAEATARALAPLVASRPTRPRAVTVDSAGLLDLVEAADTSRRHGGGPAAPSPSALLRTPIGTGDDGAAIQLDLKEAAEGGMGPHGFIVGATGSGKSELLRVLVAGLALTHTPEELAFVLADYKGGATFAEVAGLPHVAGTITNLEHDAGLVDRMREALGGELEGRQRLLATHGFDRARDYQAHRATHAAAGLPPLPSLVVIVDEFGELLDARPDFLDLLVSIGRTGRSLGVHLLLASQRLQEGRIRGLEGHLRYRICLRTFSAEESTMALGSRAAFDLPPLPGLGYVQVDAVTWRFKAALATRPRRVSAAPSSPARVLRAFDLVAGGTTLAALDGEPDAVAPAAGPAAGVAQDLHGRARTDLAVAVQRASAAASPAQRARQVWLPPLPAALPLDAVLTGRQPARPGSPGWLQLPIGLLDRPREQAQPPLVVDLGGADGHLAVAGAPRTGRSTLLQTLVAALALTHSPADVQVYAIDLGGGGLHALAGLPHVGAVCGRGEPERIRRVVRELRAMLDERATAFRTHGLSDMAGWHAARVAGRLGDVGHGEVLCVVDNWAALVAELPDVAEELAGVAAAGLSYGLHVGLSVARWGDVRSALRDNLGGRLELRLGDPMDSLLDRHAARSLPRDTPGRGLAGTGVRFQAALPRVDGVADAGGVPGGMEDLLADVAGRWPGAAAAPPIHMLPLEVRPVDLPDPATDPGPGIAIGVEEIRLAPARLDLFGVDAHLLVVGDAECGKSTVLRCLLRRLTARYGPDQLRVGVVDYRRRLAGELTGLPHLLGYARTPTTTATLAATLAAEASGRLPTDAMSVDDPAAAWSGPRLLLIVDDYDLVASATGNPLSGLVDLLAHGRDIGLHVLVARRAGGIGRAAFEPLLQRLRELDTPALIMRGDPTEGAVLGGVKPDPSLPPGRAVLVRRHTSTLVQLAHLQEGR
jgi:DNA segregation ATPase FtsK/SpoIIIE, S-DNA-T family